MSRIISAVLALVLGFTSASTVTHAAAIAPIETGTGKTKKGLETDGYTCETYGAGGYLCTKGDSKYLCDRTSGKCVKSPLAAPTPGPVRPPIYVPGPGDLQPTPIDPGPAPQPCEDTDDDGVCDADDVCVLQADPDQEDTDGDGVGDACDACMFDPTNTCSDVIAPGELDDTCRAALAPMLAKLWKNHLTCEAKAARGSEVVSAGEREVRCREKARSRFNRRFRSAEDVCPDVEPIVFLELADDGAATIAVDVVGTAEGDGAGRLAAKLLRISGKTGSKQLRALGRSYDGGEEHAGTDRGKKIRAACEDATASAKAKADARGVSFTRDYAVCAETERHAAGLIH